MAKFPIVIDNSNGVVRKAASQDSRGSFQGSAMRCVGTRAEKAAPFTEWELFRRVLDWEMGLLTGPDTEALFQTLLSKGLLRHCSGPVRRTASVMIYQGRIHHSGL
jgi:hypothetical protein